MNAAPTIVGTVLLAALLGASALAAPPGPRPRAASEHPVRPDPREAATDIRRDRAEPEVGRRGPEPSPPHARSPEAPWEVTVRRRDGCQAAGLNRLTAELLSLHNQSDLMSLEVWGDAHAYAPYDRVTFYFRAPRPMYVTLYWIGPEGQVTVPIDNLRIPANRDASVDTGGFIVPPFGREQWVALGTLEPVPLGCSSEDGLLAGVAGRVKLPHGVGRWEVWSKDAVAKERR